MLFAGSCRSPVNRLVLYSTQDYCMGFFIQPVETELFPHREGRPSYAAPKNRGTLR